jgi:hypothetical protein
MSPALNYFRNLLILLTRLLVSSRNCQERIQGTIMCNFGFSVRRPARVIFAALLLALVSLSAPPAFADGCFVFKWNKGIDINEPTQKAIIVHDAGRENMLLQVKYEGPLEEFGWLIPVPSIPTVEKGSMEPFYELSQLTQREFGMRQGVAYRGGSGGKGIEDAGVKVVEIKTVGAYEVAILSAHDAGSLDQWLKAHDYSIPEGKVEIVDEYIRKGWYFVAAKIQLDRDVAFKMVNNASPKASQDTTAARKTLERQLSTGELHPLLISFDSPRCIFPLKISSVTGKPSEISLYVLSPDPLLERSTFDQALEQLHRRHVEADRDREKNRTERAKLGRISMLNHQSLSLAWRMYAMNSPSVKQGRREREWTAEDLKAMSEESLPPMPAEPLEDNSFYALPYELLHRLQVAPEKIPKSTKALPRLRNGNWHLTKFVRTFGPAQMHDLEFEPAIPVAAQCLPGPEGSIAASLLSTFGSNAVPAIISACASTNTAQRINASVALGWPPDPRYIEPIRRLLKDELPLVRLHALNGASRCWDSSFTDPLISLLRDEHMEIRNAAAVWLGFHLPADRRDEIFALLRDQDPDLQSCALQILSRTNREAIPRADLLRLLGSPRLQTVSLSLNILNNGEWPARPAPSWPPGQAAAPARAEKPSVSSQEAVSLLTNRITMARLMGLKILEQNGDTTAIDLALPCLRDTNSIVRNRSFNLLRTASGQDFPKDEPEKWDQWWSANRASFAARQTNR